MFYTTTGVLVVRLEEFLLDPGSVDVPGQRHEEAISQEDEAELADQLVLERRHRSHR